MSEIGFLVKHRTCSSMSDVLVATGIYEVTCALL